MYCGRGVMGPSSSRRRLIDRATKTMITAKAQAPPINPIEMIFLLDLEAALVVSLSDPLESDAESVAGPSEVRGLDFVAIGGIAVVLLEPEAEEPPFAETAALPLELGVTSDVVAVVGDGVWAFVEAGVPVVVVVGAGVSVDAGVDVDTGALVGTTVGAGVSVGAAVSTKATVAVVAAGAVVSVGAGVSTGVTAAASVPVAAGTSVTGAGVSVTGAGVSVTGAGVSTGAAATEPAAAS